MSTTATAKTPTRLSGRRRRLRNPSGRRISPTAFASLQADTDLDREILRHITSDLKVAAKLCGRKLEQLPCDPVQLRPILRAVMPARYRLTGKRWSSIKSSIARVLRAANWLDAARPRGAPLWSDWQAGADAIAIGHSALMALNCNKEIPGVTDYEGTIGVPAGQCYHCHTGRCPVGITTQDPELQRNFDPIEGGRRLANYLRVLTMEAQTIARACGKSHLRNLEPQDLVALTIESAAMARVPLAGTEWIPGRAF